MITALGIALSALFLAAGIAKLLRATPLKVQFEEFGLPASLMSLVGAAEVAGALGLQIDRLRIPAALGLALLMAGAVANHLKVKHPVGKLLPSAMLLLLLGLFLALHLA